MFILTYLDPETSKVQTCKDADLVYVTKRGVAIEISDKESVYIPWHRVNGIQSGKKEARNMAENIATMRA